MPELPEVETMVRGIRQAVAGSLIVGFEPCPNTCRPITVRPTLDRQAALCVGHTIVSVRRRAKRVLLELDHGWTFVIEPRMTGLMLLADPPDVGHLRVVWKLRHGGESRSLWFWDRRGLGTISLLNPAGLERAIGPHKLGPDALELTADHWREICGRTARPIKVALLDQKLVAGIGNLYASEMLFRAGISPLASACHIHLAADHPEGYDRYSPMVSRLLHLLVIDVLATCVALRIGPSLQPVLQQIKDNLRAKRYT